MWHVQQHHRKHTLTKGSTLRSRSVCLNKQMENKYVLHRFVHRKTFIRTLYTNLAPLHLESLKVSKCPVSEYAKPHSSSRGLSVQAIFTLQNDSKGWGWLQVGKRKDHWMALAGAENRTESNSMDSAGPPLRQFGQPRGQSPVHASGGKGMGSDNSSLNNLRSTGIEWKLRYLNCSCSNIFFWQHMQPLEGMEDE